MSDAPVFDFGKVKRKWRNAIVRANARVERLAARVDALNGDLTVDDAEIDGAWDALEAATVQRDTLLAEVIESVPDGWLIDDRPDGIQWSEPGTMDYLRPDKVQALMTALTEAMTNPAGK